MGWDWDRASWDWPGTAGRSWVEKHRLKALYPLGQWFSGFFEGMIKRGNSSGVVGQTHAEKLFRM